MIRLVVFKSVADVLLLDVTSKILVEVCKTEC